MPVLPELLIRLPNSPGALAACCAHLSEARVDIVALSLESTGQLRLVVNNHGRALAVLRDGHYQVSERDAIVANVPGGPGGLATVLALLAEAEVNVDYAYGADGRAGESAVVIGVDDPLRAATAAGL